MLVRRDATLEAALSEVGRVLGVAWVVEASIEAQSLHRSESEEHRAPPS